MAAIRGRPHPSHAIPVIGTAEKLGRAFELHLAGGSFGVLDGLERRSGLDGVGPAADG